MDDVARWAHIDRLRESLGIDGEAIAAAVVADGDEAVLEWWTWMRARADEYLSARASCASDGMLGEAFEVVLSGRETFDSAVASPETFTTPYGEEGFLLMEELECFYWESTGRSIEDPEAEPDPAAWEVAEDGWRERLSPSGLLLTLVHLPVVVIMGAALGAMRMAEAFRGLRAALRPEDGRWGSGA
ncbi:hypothetical protein [Demequina salsinemoris]|uniref:hypothetical protein n=1 Tax=Demequina salsinemoris TaxID=577470 RepID=UPI00078662CD|nr:hypothetical protein [Demequina salsinemoris]